VWHLYVVRVSDRDEVLRRARAQGIGASVHYPTPVHLTPAMAEFGAGAGSMPVSEQAAKEILSLPIYPGITEAQQERVADVVRSALGAGSA
jgi:dTDP-4-amino-4,6-dideoxygalactose transaminase